MTTVAILDPIARSGLERLASAGFEVCDLTDADARARRKVLKRTSAIVVRSGTNVDARLMEEAPQLAVIGRAGVGVDNIDITTATERGIVVVNSPRGNTAAAAEHTLALLFSLARHIAEADAMVKAGSWNRASLTGREVRDKVLGVVGLGKVGFEVARLAAALGMRVCTFDPIVTTQRAAEAGARLVPMEELLRDSDVISLHVPLSETTQNLLGKRQFSLMKRGVQIINVARGDLIDEAALVAGLKSGAIAAAALDVFSTEPLPANSVLRDAPRILLTPHIGASTEEAQIGVSIDVADEIIGILGGRPPRFGVNAPSPGGEELSRILQYTRLARTLGRWAAQMCGSTPQRISCVYSGELAHRDTSLLTSEVVAGALASSTGGRINIVNARMIAARKGIAIEEQANTAPSAHLVPMTVKISGTDSVEIGGNELDGEPHITLLDGYRIDVVPEGHFLIGNHHDRPGIIASVAGALAEYDLNIAGIYLGRDRPRGRALMVIHVDDPPAPEMVATILGKTRLQTLKVVHESTA